MLKPAPLPSTEREREAAFYHHWIRANLPLRYGRLVLTLEQITLRAFLTWSKCKTFTATASTKTTSKKSKKTPVCFKRGLLVCSVAKHRMWSTTQSNDTQVPIHSNKLLDFNVDLNSEHKGENEQEKIEKLQRLGFFFFFLSISRAD